MSYIDILGQKAKACKKDIAFASTTQKNDALLEIAHILRVCKDDIIETNKVDLENGRMRKMSEAMLDRLALNDSRIEGMAKACEELAQLDDPVGEVVSGSTRPNGMKIEKVRVPMGVIGIIFEARHTFQCRLDDPYLQNMPLKQPPDIFGSQQMIRLLIEQFLIHLARRYSASYTSVVRPKDTMPAAKSTKSKNDIEVYSLVTEYMKEHIRSHVTIEQICKDNLVGRSRLQKIFKNQCGLGIIDYFSKLKINTAKELIRSRHMNFTQISDYLGYTSIHYFSRQFKKETGMTPSEYASSIKAMSEGKFEEN